MNNPAKPLLFRLGAWLAGCLGQETFFKILNFLYRLTVRLPPAHAALASRLKRIQDFNKRSCDPGTIAALLKETAFFQTQSLMSLLIPDADSKIQSVALDFLPVIQRLRERKKGVILVSPHFNNPPLLMRAIAQAGIPLNVLLLHAKPYLWAEENNLRFLELGESARACQQALSRNEAVLLYADMDFFQGGRRADFFSAPVPPPHGPARLALACASPILPVYLVYREGAHHLECDEPIMIARDSSQETIENLILRSMEKYISLYPPQWLLWNDPWSPQLRRHPYVRQ